MDKDIAKKPKQAKMKLVVQHDDNNEDIFIMKDLKNFAIFEPFSSNVKTMLHALKHQKTPCLASTHLISVSTSSITFETPLKLRNMMSTLASLSGNHIGLDLILNDFFAKLIEDKKQKSAFGPPFMLL